MGKFKVGDIITGTSRADTLYSNTNSEMIGEVIRLINNDSIEIKIIDHNTRLPQIGKTYYVLANVFKLIKSSSNSQKQTKMKKVVQDVDKVDVQLAQDCTVNGYYGLMTKSKKSYFLIKANGKWVWASAGGDTNYTLGDSNFQTAMDRALEFDDNIIVLLDEQKDLFQFMSNPEKYHSDLP